MSLPRQPTAISDLSPDLREAARELWGFHCVYDDLAPADAIVCLGSYDLRVADRGAALFADGVAAQVLCTGAAGNWTHQLYPGSEAQAFAERAKALGVPASAILLEEDARNIGENIRFAAQLLTDAKRVVLVTKPQTQRRCQATVLKQWPDVEIAVTAPLVGLSEQPLEHHVFSAVLSEMVGDLARMHLYEKLGYQVPVCVPKAVQDAFEVLLSAGFDAHMP